MRGHRPQVLRAARSDRTMRGGGTLRRHLPCESASNRKIPPARPESPFEAAFAASFH